mmetsp:Transcript_92391/g.135044  ORF Transcript_92391/g.135044 Transcript_92391/m.135044 type:complete len:226 (-) Transcript_92391:503-1180(-)
MTCWHVQTKASSRLVCSAPQLRQTRAAVQRLLHLRFRVTREKIERKKSQVQGRSDMSFMPVRARSLDKLHPAVLLRALSIFGTTWRPAAKAVEVHPSPAHLDLQPGGGGHIGEKWTRLRSKLSHSNACLPQVVLPAMPAAPAQPLPPHRARRTRMGARCQAEECSLRLASQALTAGWAVPAATTSGRIMPPTARGVFHWRNPQEDRAQLHRVMLVGWRRGVCWVP